MTSRSERKVNSLAASDRRQQRGAQMRASILHDVAVQEKRKDAQAKVAAIMARMAEKNPPAPKPDLWAGAKWIGVGVADVPSQETPLARIKRVRGLD